MTSSDLDKLWSDLPPASNNQLSGRRAAGLPPECKIYIAIDETKRRQLLISILPDTEPLVRRGMRGLDILTSELEIGDTAADRYIQLICLHPVHHTTFAGLCTDIIAAALADPIHPTVAVSRCLDRWRSFWTVDPTGLSHKEMLGLFGELWFLYRWLKLSAGTVEHWTGPAGARHDFQWHNYSIEAKTALAGPNKTPVHFIANLDQMDEPVEGKLLLFSLHLTEDSLAKNSLSMLIDRITNRLTTDPDALSLFTQRLALTGYSPAHAERYLQSYRIISEELYSVENDFPRLTRHTLGSSLPTGIEGISYCLAMSSCRPWRIAQSPSDEGASFLRLL